MFGAQIYVANLVTTGMAQEMGPLMAAVIMAGRTGAAFAAELGTMQVNQETDALRTLGGRPDPVSRRAQDAGADADAAAARLLRDPDGHPGRLASSA